MESINERIKQLRKEKGWTQLELAEKLHVSDKAVSKWETGEGYPELSILIELANVFDVTTDYLLTGIKVEEKINLDDMDAEKRLFYLIEKDDAENFKKYGYVKADYLVCEVADRSSRREPYPKVRSALLQNKPVKILNLLLDEFVSTCKRHPSQSSGNISPATFVYGYLDEFVKMCASLNRVDVLEHIKFHWFAVGNQYQSEHTYWISSDVFTFIMENPDVNEETRKYVLQINFPQMGKEYGYKYKYFLLTDEIIYCMYKYKRFDLLENAMNLLEQNNDNLIKDFVEAPCGYGQKKRISYNRCMIGEPGYAEHPVGVIIPIVKAFEKAQRDLDIKWIEIFNKYNSVISKICSNGNVTLDSSKSQFVVLSEKDLEILRMKANPSVDNDKVLVFQHTKDGLLDVKGLLSSVQAAYKTPESANQAIETATRLYNNYIKTAYVHPCELIEDCLAKKNYRKIFEFSVDNNIEILVKLILQQKYDELMSHAKQLYYLPASQRTRTRTASYLTSNSSLYVFLRENCDITDESVESFVAKCAEYKEELYNNFVNHISVMIKTFFGEREIQESYDRICSEATKEYLMDLLNNGQYETLIIKLCVKLEAKLKHTYKLSGELREMLDSYISSHMGNNDRSARLLHKLRMIRNGIVHADNSDEKLNNDELLQIIELVEKM